MKKFILFLIVFAFSLTLFGCFEKKTELILNTENVVKEFHGYDKYNTDNIIVTYKQDNKETVVNDYKSYLSYNGKKVDNFNEDGEYKVVISYHVCEASYKVNYSKNLIINKESDFEIIRYSSSNNIICRIDVAEEELDKIEDGYLVDKNKNLINDNFLDVIQIDENKYSVYFYFKLLEKDSKYTFLLSYYNDEENLVYTEKEVNTINDNFFKEKHWDFGVTLREDSPFVLKEESLSDRFGNIETSLLILDDFGKIKTCKTRAQVLFEGITNIVARNVYDKDNDIHYIDSNYIYFNTPKFQINELSWQVTNENSNKGPILLLKLSFDYTTGEGVTFQEGMEPGSFGNVYYIKDGVKSEEYDLFNAYLNSGDAMISISLEDYPSDGNYTVHVDYSFMCFEDCLYIKYCFDIDVVNGVCVNTNVNSLLSDSFTYLYEYKKVIF